MLGMECFMAVPDATISMSVKWGLSRWPRSTGAAADAAAVRLTWRSDRWLTARLPLWARMRDRRACAVLSLMIIEGVLCIILFF